MMIAFILALGLVSQEEPVEKLIKAAVARDAAAGKKLRERGALAMRPLLDARSRFSGEELQRLDDFIFEQKKSISSDPDPVRLYETLGTRLATFSMAAIPFDEVLGFYREFLGTPIVIDPRLIRELGAKKIDVQLKDVTFRVALDAAARSVGAEWVVRYGVILISSPARLWAEPPRESRKLKDEELREVRELIKRLGSESMDEREMASSRLRELGRGAEELVANAARTENDAEIVARCKTLLGEWAPPARAALAEPCGMDLQKLTGEEKSLSDKIRRNHITIKVADIQFSSALRLLFASEVTPLSFGAAAKDVSVDLDFVDVPMYAMVALATKAIGFDFCVKDGKIHVDTAEEIHKIVGGK